MKCKIIVQRCSRKADFLYILGTVHRKISEEHKKYVSWYYFLLTTCYSTRYKPSMRVRNSNCFCVRLYTVHVPMYVSTQKSSAELTHTVTMLLPAVTLVRLRGVSFHQ